jgi:prefoldin subunit 5
MAESQLVSGLVEKRAELAGEVEHYQQELQRLAAELGHLDATIATWRRLNTASTAASISHRYSAGWFMPVPVGSLAQKIGCVLPRVAPAELSS